MGRVIAVPTAENPTGSGILPRKLRRCPRKATARSANQLIAAQSRIFHQVRRIKSNKIYEKILLKK
ncbi:hypothetical protein GH741_04885 [Aquibacillus halophilus]|uniref:Uncharacterized protein n=1 Tax=Aquibacillus halophilus TaxID=930132 RepID=A0A6A8D9Q5_9BACI|nr:hypothetical protein [Aquibacillus halophilus]MRH42010.1 hypothetical protein [Aquibacillus halophilus]